MISMGYDCDLVFITGSEGSPAALIKAGATAASPVTLSAVVN
jgi:hypothetical protein